MEKIFNEIEIIDNYRHGDLVGLNQLITYTKDRVYTSVYLLIREKYLAEDITQDAYLKAFEQISAGRYQNDGKFQAWVIRIARNLCMDYFRAGKRHKKVVLTEDRDVFDWIASEDQPCYEQVLIEEQTSQQLIAMLDKLPLEQKEVVNMRIYASLSYKEIAEELDISINTALGRMRYAMLNLRKIIQEYQVIL